MAEVTGVKKSMSEIATIDCCRVVVEMQDGKKFGFDTSSKVQVEAQIQESEPTQLIVKGVLIAQKPSEATITGHQITLTDNVVNLELAVALQGGTIKYADPGTNKIISGYTPPVAGSKPDIKPFTLYCYSAQYDASGQVVNYEQIMYPNCVGKPFAFSSEDGVFRAPEYVIMSAPRKGQAPYDIEYFDELPTLEPNA